MDSNNPQHETAAIEARRYWLAIAAVFFGSLLWFWFFRSNGFTGGDSEQWEREVVLGRWFRRRQMLSFASMQLGYQLMHALAAWPGWLAINLVSSLFGAGAMVAIWLYFEGMRHRLALFLLTATTGWTAVFYGHIETYAQPACAMLWHLLAVKRVLQGRWPLWSASFTWALWPWFHLVALFSFPAHGIFMVRRWRAAELNPFCAAAAYLPVVALALLFLFHRDNVPGEFIGALIFGRMQEAVSDPAELWGFLDLYEKAWFFLWNGGVAGILALGILPLALRPGAGERLQTLAGYLICYLFFFLIWEPHRGLPDWDLYIFPFVVGGLLAGERVMDIPGRAAWIGLIAGVNLYTLILRPIQWAEVSWRGSGVVAIIPAWEGRNPIMLIDDRTPLMPVNYYVPRGVRKIRVNSVSSETSIVSFLSVEPGQVTLLLIDDTQIIPFFPKSQEEIQQLYENRKLK